MKQLFSLKSNFYFLQKLVFALFCFLLGFLLGSGMLKAKAVDENILDYTQQYDDFKELDFTNIYKSNSEIKYESFKNELDNMISELDRLNIHYLIAFEYMHKKGDYANGGFTSQMRIFIFNNNISTVPFLLKKNGIYTSTSSSWSNTDVRANTYTFKYGSKFVTSLESFSNYLNNNNQLPGTKGGYLQDDLSSIYYSTSTPFAPYYGFYDNTDEFCYLYHYNNINITASMSGFDGIKIGDTILRNEMPVYTELEYYGKQANIYNVNDIDHIEVEFDLNNIPSSALIPNNEEYFRFEMSYDIKITSDEAGSILEKNKTLDVPQIEYMKVENDGLINTSKYGLSNNRLNQYNKYFGKDKYTNTYLASYDYVRTLKLIINCRDINDVYLNLDLQSNLKYTINIFYRENVEDYRKYYKTVDITGKYAVVFIPRIRLDGNQNSVSSYFISNGSFKVEERDTYLNEFNLYKNPVKISGTNQYYYFYALGGELHKNDSFYYKNLNYPKSDLATIQYDSRYFTISICMNDYECETVINPNTGEEIKPNTSPDDEEWNLNKIFDIVDDYLKQVREVRDYFNKCFEAFWKQVPIVLQTILIFIYIMLNMIVLVRIGGWTND